MTTETKTNGYDAKDLQPMIKNFETAAAKVFPDCTLQHFYYGNNVDMVDVVFPNRKSYAHFNVYKNRVSLCGYTCSHEELSTFGSLTYRDECYDGKLLSLVN